MDNFILHVAYLFIALFATTVIVDIFFELRKIRKILEKEEKDD